MTIEIFAKIKRSVYVSLILKNFENYYSLLMLQFKRSGGVWEDVNKLYNLKDYESNKFINLGANCSGYRIHDDECERLKRNLTNPTGEFLRK